jgi:hypothetical protein
MTNSSTSIQSGAMPNSSLSADKEYAEVCSQIKGTDEISFKLLGFVPLVTGASILSLFLRNEDVSSPRIFLISIFSAAVTLGIFRWELRNVQICNWLRSRADRIIGTSIPGPPGGWGKTEAECLLYGATILAWLALPWIWSIQTLNSLPLVWVLTAAIVQLLLMVFMIEAILHRPRRET